MRSKDDDDTVIEDGGSVTVRLPMMDAPARTFAFDARDHQPHFASRPVNDAEERRALAHAVYVQRLTNAWKVRPSRDAAPPTHLDPAAAMKQHLFGGEDDDAQAKRDSAYESYKTNLGNAWRRSGPPWPQSTMKPNLGAGPAGEVQHQGEVWRGGA